PGPASPARSEERELLRAPDRRPATAYAELPVDVLGVRSKRVERDDELARHPRAVEIASEQAQDVELAFAECLDQAVAGGLPGRGLRHRANELAEIGRCPRSLRRNLE